MKLTEHFSLEELTQSQVAVRNGISNEPGADVIANLCKTAKLLEEVRAALKQPLLITSGYRCEAVGMLISGSSVSQHTLGLAADFHCPAYGTPYDVCYAIMVADIKFDQLIYEGTWVHISTNAGDKPLRRQMLTAVFAAGQKTKYLQGLVKFN